MQIYYQAYLAFQSKQSHGLPEEIYKDLCDEKLKMSDRELNLFDVCFKWFVKKHQEISRKSANKKFKHE